MSYNPYTAVNKIYNLKGTWESADKAGDTDKKNRAAADAQAYYAQLRDNGYDELADSLQATGYEGAKKINDKLATQGKTKTRDYLYSLGQSKGLNQVDMDKLITWDDVTGEVSLGGKKIGTPDTVIDGVSYWEDPTVLNDAWNDYVNRTNLTADRNTLISQADTGISNKINELWGLQTDDHKALTDKWGKEYEDLKNTNPFTTDEAKAILAKYDLAGLQGRDNAVASGSASNGGNIDSYSAANAMRQQASLINQGQMAVLTAHNDKLANARAILEGLGAYQKDSYAGMQNTINSAQTEAQRLFENEQTENKNFADITGHVPTKMALAADPFYAQFLDENGNFKIDPDSIDFQQLINNAKAAGNTELAEKYGVLKGMKVYGNYDKYKQWVTDDIRFAPKMETASMRDANANRQNAVDLANINANTTKEVAGIQADTTKYAADKEVEGEKYAADKSVEGTKYAADKSVEAAKIKGTDLSISQVTTALKNGNLSDAVLQAYNAAYGTNYTKDNPPPEYKASGDDDGWSDDSNTKEGESDWDTFRNRFDDEKVLQFVDKIIKPYYDESRKLDEEIIEQLIVGEDPLHSNSTTYDIDVEDARAICAALGLNSSWVDKYANRTVFNSGKGMKLKE